MDALSNALGIETGNQALILEMMKANFSGNEGFSSFGFINNDLK